MTASRLRLDLDEMLCDQELAHQISILRFREARFGAKFTYLATPFVRIAARRLIEFFTFKALLKYRFCPHRAG